MTHWVLLLTMPLLVLPIVLLFRFVGCGLDVVGTGESPIPLPPRQPPEKTPDPVLTPVVLKPPSYRDYIMGITDNAAPIKNPGVVPNVADVIGYWRLIDKPAAGGGLDIAKDEKGSTLGQDGQFKTVPLGFNFEAKTATKAGSEAATGDFVLNQASLIVSEPTALCRGFNGGYVEIPFKTGIYTEEFTIEAWVIARPLKPDVEHTLFDAGGKYAIPPDGNTDRGFRVFEDSGGHWQVRLDPATADLFPTPPAVPRGDKPTHLAVTVANEPGGAGKKRVRLYVDGKEAANAVADAYARPDTAPLFIGVENTANVPTNPAQLRTPVLMRIQEVVLHRKPLSKEEIENHVDINRSTF